MEGLFACKHFVPGNLASSSITSFHRGIEGRLRGTPYIRSSSITLELLAPLGCGMQTGAGTVMNSLKVRKGSSVAVFGTGSVGLAAVMAARIVGADPIIAVDVKRKRLEIGLELGATHTILNRRANIRARVAKVTGGGVDYVFEITGRPEMYDIAVQILNPNGVVATFSGRSPNESLPDGKKEISIIQGDAVPRRFIPKLIKLHQRGQFPYDRLVRFYEFSQINRAISDSNKGRAVKPVLRMAK